MKKMIIALLSLTLALSLAACGGAPEVEKGAPETEANASGDEAAAPETEANASDAETTAPDTETNAPDAEANAPDTETNAPDAEANAPEDEATLSGVDANAQLANPFTDYATLAEAEAAAGFGFAAPESVEGYPETSYSVMDGGKLLQIAYRNADDEITARKAPGADAGDISGDYNQYAEETVFDKTDVAFIVKGNGGKAFAALWTDDENDYAYSLTDRNGMDMDAFTTIVTTIQALENGYEVVEAEAQ